MHYISISMPSFTARRDRTHVMYRRHSSLLPVIFLRAMLADMWDLRENKTGVEVEPAFDIPTLLKEATCRADSVNAVVSTSVQDREVKSGVIPAVLKSRKKKFRPFS
jgi:hypothetical protein